MQLKAIFSRLERLRALRVRSEIGVAVRAGKGDHVEGIHHRGGLRHDLGGGGLVAAEAVHGHDLHLATKGRGLRRQPAGQLLWDCINRPAEASTSYLRWRR